MATAVALIIPDHFANAKTQGPDLNKGKYICVVTVKYNIGFIDCDNKFTIHKKINSEKYLVRYNHKKLLYICDYKNKELINCISK